MADPTPTPQEVRVPRATYRLQFHAGFTLREAAGWVPYLARLGVSDLYASPLTQARRGSTHGYDVCNPNALNPEIGSEADFDHLCDVLRQHGLGLLLDIVPNHMGVGERSNRWWWDVLEWGPSSRYATYFDINWHPAHPGMRGKVLVPILGAAYGEVLERGELRLERGGEGLEIHYYDHHFPLSSDGWAMILEAMTAAGDEQDLSAAEVGELRGLHGALDQVTGVSALCNEAQAARWAEWKQQFTLTLSERSSLGQLLGQVISQSRGRPGDPASYDWLHQLLLRQHYRLAWWRLGPSTLNYRRFFDITHLAGLRVEVPEVFLDAHELVARWWHEGRLTGLRIDHPDGLWNPAAYFRRLQRLAREAAPESLAQGGPDTRGRTLYVLAEKILSEGESLPADWPIHGTTGYDFLNLVNGVLVPTDQVEVFTGIYERFIDRSVVFGDEVHRNKRRILQESLISEWDRLTGDLLALMAGTREGWDYSHSQWHEAVGELLAAFPVYRTYAEPDQKCLPPQQVAQVDLALRSVTHRNPGLPPSLLNLLGRLLKLEWPARQDVRFMETREWVMRFQQLTGPVMAKGLEDTTFYSFNRLVSLNEVGGHPSHFGLSLTEFHQANKKRRETWNGTLLATATHDTKRGEDLRARINVLAELPDVWERALVKFRALTGALRPRLHGRLVPSANDEYLLYQTLVGLGLPDPETLRSDASFQQRVEAYCLKAAREAKVDTTWTDPDPAYEEALLAFVRTLLDPDQSGGFQEVVRHLAAQVAWFGKLNALSQTVLKLTVPGVPDLYQGTEFWDLSLVDPDNRRPVDFAERDAALTKLEDWVRTGGPTSEQLDRLWSENDGCLAKLWIQWRLLAARRQDPHLWHAGDYQPLSTAGRQGEHLVAFVRTLGEQALVVVVPRLIASLTGGAEHMPLGEAVWRDTELVLPKDWGEIRLKDYLTGARVTTGPRLRIAEVLSRFPAAVLTRLPLNSNEDI